MRILLVSHGLPPESVGGVEQHVSGLASALVTQGHDVEIFARSNAPDHEEGTIAEAEGANPKIWRVTYRWQNVQSLEDMYTSSPMAAAMAHFLTARKAEGTTYDIAHVHHLTGMSVDSLAELRTAGVPTVMTLHDYWLFCPRGQMYHHQGEACETAPVARCTDCLSKTFPWWLKENGAQKVESVQERARTVLSIPHQLIAPSARAIPPFVNLGVAAERFTVVENGVDTEHLHALPPPSIGDGPLRLGYFGTLIPSKGLHVLIEAVLQLPLGLVELHIHGNSVPYHGDEGYLKRCFLQLKPDSPVTYHGPYSLADMPARMATIDVLAAPALWHEAFGLTVREALAAGRPALVSKIGGLQDALEDGIQGRLLPPGDVPAWATAIRELAEDPKLLRQYVGATRDRARGFAAMATDLSIIYREASQGPGRS